MNRSLKLAMLAMTATSLAAPALAQTASETQRFRNAQARYDRETQIYRTEQDRYQAAQRRGYRGGYQQQGYRSDQGYPNQGYPNNQGYSNGQGYPNGQGYSTRGGRAPDDRDEAGYDPQRYYRDGNYQERTLSADERVYAGSDGKYYCKRSDGTTGLVIGGAAGGLLGNVIDGGHSRIVGTLLGGAAGALLGKSVDQHNSEVHCR